MLDLRLADIIRDEKMLRYARDLAAEILKSDPDLVKNNNHILKERLSQLKKHQKDWSLIS
jgi:ATP-dependent DNA helicase RecG